jgi:hypothetical protein
MKVPSVPVYSEIASKFNKKIFTVPMANNQHAEILYDANSLSAYVIKDNKSLVFAKGFQGSKNHADFAANTATIVAHLKNLGLDVCEFAAAFQDSCAAFLRNVK